MRAIGQRRFEWNQDRTVPPPPAHHKALELTRNIAADVEYWPTVDATGIEGSREQRLQAYRDVRDQLMAHIRERFGKAGQGNE